MAITFRDRYKTTLTDSPATAEDFSIGNAVEQFHTFGAADDGLEFDIVVVDTNDDWEIREFCSYDHANKRLSRGTLVDSSTGGVINLSSSAILAVTLLAKRVPTQTTSGTVTNVSATSPINVTNGSTTPSITIAQASTTTDGYLSSTDWNLFNAKQNTLSQANGTTDGYLTSTDWTTFNNKQPALGFIPYDSANPAGYTSNLGTVTTVSGNGPISVATGSTTPSITIAQASTTTDGYLTSTDWNTFNSKGAPYTLPVATPTELGGVKVDNTTITVAGDGTLSAASAGSTSLIRQWVKNGSGSAMTKGQAVYVSGADGTNVLISLAKADAESTSSKTLGLLEQDLAINAVGWVVTEGILGGLNTNSANAGDPIWLSASTAGGLIYGLVNKPKAPDHLVYIGTVTRKNTNNGEIFVKISNGWEIEEIHDVQINTKTNNDLLVYESATNLWKNKQLASTQVTTALGFTPYDATNPAGYTTNLGTVTTVSATGPLSVATGSTTPALTIAQANGTTAGYLSSTDWNTFNGKLSSIPTASDTVLGGVKVGSGLSIDGSGILSATGGGGGSSTTPITTITSTTAYNVTSADQGKILNFTADASITINLPQASSVGNGFSFTVYAKYTDYSTNYRHTLVAYGTEIINGRTNIGYREGITIISDGTGWITELHTTIPIISQLGSIGTNQPVVQYPDGVSIGNSFCYGSQSISIFNGINNSAYIGSHDAGQFVMGSAQGRSGANGSFVFGSNNIVQALSSVSIGGNSNNAAGNRSVTIGGINNSAIGSYSVNIGGYHNMSTGNRSVTIGGDYNTADSDYAIALGSNCYAHGTNSIALGSSSQALTTGKFAYATPNNSFSGTGQFGLQVLKRLTSDATPAILTSDHGTASYLNQISVESGSAVAFNGTIVARQQNTYGTIAAAWNIKGLLERQLAASSTVLVDYSIETISNTNNLSFTLTADTTNGCLAITVTGLAGTMMAWVATVNTTELQYL